MTIWDDFYNSSEQSFSSGPIADASVRRYKKIEVILLEDSLEMLNKL